jgi:hypothetical protein
MVHHPFHPIIYVRGFAATSDEIEAAASDPFMGFNTGSTKSRIASDKKPRRFYFESPVIRLASDHDYKDVIVGGEDMVGGTPPKEAVPYRCIVVHRFYEEASEELGTGETPGLDHFARGLGELILRLRERVCANMANGVKPEDFRVYLVAHSMGGLICRVFLQDLLIGADPAMREARQAVDKFFTYATPHNGIDLKLAGNVPGWVSVGSVNNFNRRRLASLLGLPEDAEDVSELRGLPPERVFNLVGTNSADYPVLGGLSSWAAGAASDGLVRTANATTFGYDQTGARVESPRAFVHRSHSGHYGIVNSEEGYQNLTRFLFGGVRMDGILELEKVILPHSVEDELKKGRAIRASYQFETSVSVRGCLWQMHRRRAETYSAIVRTYDELFPRDSDGKRQLDPTRSPHLFSVFLDPAKSHSETGSVSFAFEINALVPDYEIDGLLFLDHHYEGGSLYADTLIVEAFPDVEAPGGWSINYGFESLTPGKAPHAARTEITPDGALVFFLPVERDQRPGLKGHLRIEARQWNQAPR